MVRTWQSSDVKTTALVDALASDLSGVLGAREVSNLRRLTGGASRETWRFDADGSAFVLQRVRPGTIGGLKQEPSVLLMAAQHGVPVPELVFDGSASTALTEPFMIVRAVEGETIARKIQRDDAFGLARQNFCRDAGAALAKLHSIDVAEVSGLENEDQVVRYRDVLDFLNQPHPTFELVFHWLRAHAPVSQRHTIVHGDFRLGNLMIGPEGIAAVLDWELAHLGDPMEDLGWLCVKAWRFGGAAPVAGLGSYDDLFASYEQHSGIAVDADAVRWWQVLGTLKWGIICISQASTHLSGVMRSHELAAIGRRVCENEYDLFRLLEGEW